MGQMMAREAQPFWEAPLASLDAGQWEALCDGCGKCCLHKLEDEDTGRIYPTNVACRLLDLTTARCGDLQASPPPRSRLPDADQGQGRRHRMAAADLRLSSACRGRAAARLALSRLRRPRCGAPRGRVDRRMDGRRRYGGTARESSCRTCRLTSRPRDRTSGSATRHGRCAWCATPSLAAIASSSMARVVELRLTVPRRTNERAALKWASEQQAWLVEQVGKAALPVVVGPGTSVPFRGIDRHINWTAAAPRAIRLDDDGLHVGGPAESVGRRVERWLRGQALGLMERESRDIARGRRAGGRPCRRRRPAQPLGQLHGERRPALQLAAGDGARPLCAVQRSRTRSRICGIWTMARRFTRWSTNCTTATSPPRAAGYAAKGAGSTVIVSPPDRSQFEIVGLGWPRRRWCLHDRRSSLRAAGVFGCAPFFGAAPLSPGPRRPVCSSIHCWSSTGPSSGGGGGAVALGRAAVIGQLDRHAVLVDQPTFARLAHIGLALVLEPAIRAV